MVRRMVGRTDILIVDDDPDHRDLVERRLRGWGCGVVQCAATGGEALALCRAAAPKLILLDINLPDMSGLDVIRRLRADETMQSTLVVAITIDDGKQRECLDLGCNGFIVKPVHFPTLRETMNELGIRVAHG